MGLLDKLLKKGPKASEVTKGGSPVYRYEETEHEIGRASCRERVLTSV